MAFFHQPDAVKKKQSFIMGNIARDALHPDGRRGDVVDHGQMREQIEILEDETDPATELVEIAVFIGA